MLPEVAARLAWEARCRRKKRDFERDPALDRAPELNPGVGPTKQVSRRGKGRSQYQGLAPPFRPAEAKGPSQCQGPAPPFLVKVFFWFLHS